MQAILNNQIIRISLIFIMSSAVQGCSDGKRDKPNIRRISIDAILPLTGVAAEYGNYYKDALRSFRTVNGLEESWNLSILDSKSNPKDAVAAMRLGSSGNDQPRIVFTELSSVSMSIAPLVEEQDALLVAVAATPELENFTNVLRIYPESGTLALQFREAIVSRKQEIGNIGVFYVNDDFGASVSESLFNVFLDQGISLAFKRPIPNSSDAASEVDRLQSKDIDLVVVIGIGQPMGSLIRTIRERLPDVSIVASPEFSFESVTSQIPLQLMNKISYLAFPPILKSEADSLRLVLGRELNPLDILVFDAAEVIRQSLLEEPRVATGAELATRIRGKSFISLGRKIRIDDRGNLEYKLSLQPAEFAIKSIGQQN